MTHFGAPMGSQAKVAKFRPFLRQILTFLTPHPANQVNFSLSKMAFRGVSHTVLQVLCSTGTSGGYFRPSKVSFGAISALSGDFFYKGRCKKNVFFGTLSQTMGRWGSKVPNSLVKTTIQSFLLQTSRNVPKHAIRGWVGVQSPKQIHGILSEKFLIFSKK